MAIDMKDKIDQWFAAWNSRDPQKISQFYAVDCIFEQVAAPGPTCHNRTELVSFIKGMFYATPDLKIEPKTTFFSDNAVCGEVVMSGTMVHSQNPKVTATGIPISMRGAYISEWRDGLIKRHSYYQDYLAYMQLVAGPAAK